jgi:aminocarboxymuconate-semialdehyde decarboxylase
MALEIVGAEHILWGSDDPYIGASAEHLESLDQPEADKRLMLGSNATRLFRLDAA